MALRLLEAHVPADLAPEAAKALHESGSAEVWTEQGGCFGTVVRAVIGASSSGEAMDLLHRRLDSKGGLRVLVTTLDAVLPRPAASDAVEARKERLSAAAVSREEIYANVSDGAHLTATYLSLVVLATAVAAVGLTSNNTAAVIGAMVVAPLLGPNMGLALGFTLGDRSLIAEAVRTALVGVGVAFGVSLLLGLMMPVDPSTPEIASRTRVGYGDLLLAFAAGCAGTLGFTTGAPTFVVGVMVAVALLPPTVASGLLLGAGHTTLAGGAMLLTGANIAAVNLAAMLTFVGSGIRPRTWWGEERARASTRTGIAIFAAMLGLLILALAIARLLGG